MREWHKWLYDKQAGLIGLSNLQMWDTCPGPTRTSRLYPPPGWEAGSEIRSSVWGGSVRPPLKRVRSNVKKMSARFRAGGYGAGIGFKRVKEKKISKKKD